MSNKQTLLAVKVNGMIYRRGRTAPKPLDLDDATHKHGPDGKVARVARSGNAAKIIFQDGETFMLANMPAVYLFGDAVSAEPNNETAAGDGPAEA